MMLLPCPHCGRRDAGEFGYVDERRVRPAPDSATPEQWRSYLYERTNPAGWVGELWFHRAGCGRYLYVERHTGTNEVRACESASGGG